MSWYLCSVRVALHCPLYLIFSFTFFYFSAKFHDIQTADRSRTLKTLLRNNSNKAHLKFNISSLNVQWPPSPPIHLPSSTVGQMWALLQCRMHAELSGVSLMARHIIGVLHYIISNHSCRKFQVLAGEEPFIRDHHRPCGLDEEGGPTAAQHHLLF